jgi:malate permease and related proteins
VSNSLLMFFFFVTLGIGWRLLSPQGIGAAALQRQLMALAHLVMLPIAVFFIVSRLPMNDAALRILFYVLATTAIVLAVAWFWLWKSTLPPKTKGAFLIAAGFGNVLSLGLPLNKAVMGDWSMRVAVEYGVVANVLLLFTAGAILSRSFTEPGKARFRGPINEVLKDHRVWLKEPLLWAALAGLAVNLGGLHLPAWLGGIEAAVYGFLVPLLILSTILAVSWNNAWKEQLIEALPVVGIKLILVPLVMWGMVALFGSAGAKTSQALLLDSMMPAALLGFAACDRYKLDTGAYTMAFSATTVLALVTVPVWFNLLF